MPDAARIAQAQALEVPVILQGAKTADETGRRELFTENATTTLVFDNGAVLNLRLKLVVGQVVFLHNEQNKREILCKVLEAPAEGETGHTELEFTAVAPGFWEAVVEQPEASAQNPQPAAEMMPAQEPVPAPAPEPAPESSENPLAMMSSTASTVTMSPPHEEIVPAYEPVPETAPAASATAPSEEWRAPTGEEIDAALRTMEAAPTSLPSPGTADALSHPQDAADPNDPKFQQHLAAMMARDARLAKYAAAKESQAGKIHRDAASKDAPEGATPADAASEPEVVPIRVPLSDRLTTGKNAVVVEIVACVLIAIALVFIWRAIRPAFVHEIPPPQAAVAPAKPKASPALPSHSSGPASAVGAVAPGAAGASSKAPQRAVAQKPAAQLAKVAAAAPAAVGSGWGSAVAKTSPAPADAQMPARRDTLASSEAAAQPKHRKPDEPDSLDTVPAKILLRPQPAFPDWAKSLDIDDVVTLDAVIDEKGNVAELKVLSGPRQLQHAAEQAVGLWQFEPAQSAGKPTTTHMVLTVEFQR
ncbi:MAG TPA: energy transducer TonB [Candidatus Acidoferrales bacterium]|nr:energy transducer TonB [Candidatus Acidoferrales bacterium]